MVQFLETLQLFFHGRMKPYGIETNRTSFFSCDTSFARSLFRCEINDKRKRVSMKERRVCTCPIVELFDRYGADNREFCTASSIILSVHRQRVFDTRGKKTSMLAINSQHVTYIVFLHLHNKFWSLAQRPFLHFVKASSDHVVLDTASAIFGE